MYNYEYQSESPDEIALLEFSYKIGIQFIGKKYIHVITLS